MTDTHILPKWLFTILVLLLSIFVLSIKKLCNKPLQINVLVYSYIIIIVCSCQALYGIAQWFHWIPSTEPYNVVGSFDNAAGFTACLCIGLPFVMICLSSVKDRIWKRCLYLLASIIILAVILSASRSGIISIAFVISIWLYRYIPLKIKGKAIVFACVLFLFFGYSYFLKKDSADGRLLIWKCSYEMLKKSPVYGHGVGSFRAHYMDYQAIYFKEHPNSKYATLADNVLCPFNEYLTVMINFGIVGLFILFALISFLIFCYCNKPRYEGQAVLLSLLCISIISIFSYPFTYPFVWVVICFNIYVLAKDVCTLKIYPIYEKLLYTLIIISCLFLSYKLYQRMNAEYKWNNIACRKVTDKTLAAYMKLIPVLGDNPYFLYNDAITLFGANHFNESLEKALLCRTYWADYDLELLLGDIYKQKKIYGISEIHYKNASLMCPCRFIPLYQMFELYKETGEKEKARTIAWIISKKSVKVNTMVVMQIQNKVSQWLKKNDTQYNNSVH